MRDFKLGDEVAPKTQHQLHMHVLKVSDDGQSVQTFWTLPNGDRKDAWFPSVALMHVADIPSGVWFTVRDWEPRGF